MESTDQSTPISVDDERRVIASVESQHARLALRLTSECRLPFCEDSEEDFYIRSFHGDILCDPGDGGKPVLVGEVSLRHAIAASVADIAYWADAHSDSMAEIAADLFDQGNIVNAVNETYRYITNPDFVGIECIKILPQFRSRGIGRMVIEAIIELFRSSCGIIALKPFPIECDRIDHRDSNSVKNHKRGKISRGTKRLQRFYERIGFRLLAGNTMTYSCELIHQPTLASVRRNSNSTNRHSAKPR